MSLRIRFVYACEPSVSDPVGPPVRARASIAITPVPVTVNPAPSIVTLSDEMEKQVFVSPVMLPVSVYVPGAASSPQVEIFPGNRVSADEV